MTPGNTAAATNAPTAAPSPHPTTTSHPTVAIQASEPDFLIDAHQDIAWNWLEFGRDPAESALSGRAREAGTAVAATMGGRTSSLPDWIEGQVGIVFATIFVMPLRHAYGQWQRQVYATSQEAYARANEQIDLYHALAAREPRVRLVETAQDLEEVVQSWATPETGTVGLVISMEGADPIQTPEEVREWYAKGLRIVGPAWTATRYAGGTGEPGPLTALGQELLDALEALDMILDLSHMAEEAYLEAVDSYAGAIIASHSNPRAYLPTDRGLSDEMIVKLASRGGVVGIIPYNRYLLPGWSRGDAKTAVSVQTVAEAIDYVVQLTGSAAHVGIGSDFDGGFGVESIPAEMDTSADLPLIAEALVRKGYGAEDADAIKRGNWLRVLRTSLP